MANMCLFNPWEFQKYLTSWWSFLSVPFFRVHSTLEPPALWSLLHFVRMPSLRVLRSLNERLGQIQLFGHIPGRSIGIPLKRFHYTLVILITTRTSILTAFRLPFDARSLVVTFNHTNDRWLHDSELFSDVPMCVEFSRCLRKINSRPCILGDAIFSNFRKTDSNKTTV